ncbi:MAG: Ig-like domain-containing protein, partial [Acidimicrobiales bacterium]
PAAGTFVGVGEPIVITFSQPVTALAARGTVLHHIKLFVSKPVNVGARWVSATQLHLRPKTYWPLGERVVVRQDLVGWDAGSDRWGAGTSQLHFTVTRSTVSVLDLSTRLLTIVHDGTTTVDSVFSSAPIPSLGDGIHLVVGRSKATRGALWYVQLSSKGGGVCVVLPSSPLIGRCATLTLGAAERFYLLSRVGDVVRVTGGPSTAPSAPANPDWSLPWSSWIPMPVTSLPVNKPDG